MADDAIPTVTPEPAPTELAPLLVAVDRASAMLGISSRTMRKLDAMEQVPEPIRIGRRVLWRAKELEDWVNAGCLVRHIWVAMRTPQVEPPPRKRRG